MRTFYLILADAILVLHALIVLFNVGSLPVIWLGRFLEWNFVRNFAFRIVHLLLIGFVAAEAVVGAICPLTSWEDRLRIQAGVDPRYEGGYIAHWLHQLMFYDLDQRFYHWLCDLLRAGRAHLGFRETTSPALAAAAELTSMALGIRNVLGIRSLDFPWVLPESFRGSWFEFLLETVRRGGEDKVALRQPVNLVRPHCQLDLAPRQIDVRVMALGFGEFAHFIE